MLRTYASHPCFAPMLRTLTLTLSQWERGSSKNLGFSKKLSDR